MKFIDDKYVLTSGRVIDANCGLIGINPDLEVGEGYDGRIRVDPLDWFEDETAWTIEEREELADFMIGLWTQFKTHKAP